MKFKKLTHKYSAQKCERNGLKFPSKAERNFYDLLVARQNSGNIIGFFRQIPLDLPGGLKYVMDFFVFNTDGTCDAFEVKGYETKEWLIKKKLVEETYPWLELHIVK